MLIDNMVQYEKGFLTEMNAPNDPLYLFFDYDDRSADINMEFQHFHQFYEILLLLAPKANHLMEGKLYAIEQFDIVCLPPSMLHKSQYEQGPASKRLIINFRLPANVPILGPQIDAVLSIFQAPIPIYRFEAKKQQEIFAPLNDTFQLLKSKPPLLTLQAFQSFLRFLTNIYLNRGDNLYTPEKQDSLTDKIYSITAYIHSHYGEDLSLEQLAKQFYISTYYLSHQFKEITGFTITNYVQMTRIRNAQQMLLSDNLKITEIASACGFNSFSQFNRVFNKLCGTSPSRFRSSVAKKAATERSSIPILSKTL